MENDFSDEFESNKTNETYQKRLISDIQLDDSAVQIIGYADSINASDEFYLDDKNGRIHVRSIPDEFSNIKEGTLYRVFGELSIGGDGVQFIAAHIIQNMEKMNFILFLKSMELSKKIT
ncbi:hypothetical protein DSAG12_03811 [Promethearchaeum syntrophicum]|uniref:OB-fold nucleic acid binding domain protein n=1 Tax=Promethearchaeum syntrophicum TaxID=2594042 RepID=A0A5B9DGW8_9ARCH|nr:hypothetical protein [Candidatus Prometheoarchaeum syntrophicum]QEE17973.1 hypothetical protein DSAG12_03811 [Candidatus Prometheoarchaeum syntrophicum]